MLGALSAWVALGFIHTGAYAQAAGTGAETVCGLSRTFVDTTINGSGRGGTFLISRGSEIWIAADLLRPSEAAYATDTVVCDDGTFARLSPRLTIAFDASELTLDVRTRLDLLPGNVLDLTATSRSTGVPGPSTPVISFGVRAYANRQTGQGGGDGGRADGVGTAPVVTQSLTLRGGYQVGNTDVSVEGTESGLLPNPAWTVTGRFVQAVNERLRLGVGIYGVAGAGSGRSFGLSRQQISGLEMRVGADRAYRISALSFDLPLDADITVSVNGGSAQPFRAQAGVLTLKNIPVSTPAGTISVLVRDPTGTHLLERTYEVSDVVIAAHGFAALGHVGAIGQLDPGGAYSVSPAADLSGVYGLNDRWTIGGQLLVSRAVTSGTFSVRYAATDLSAGVAADYDSSRQTPLYVTAGAAHVHGHWQEAATLRVEVPDVTRTLMTAQVSYHAETGSVALRLQASPSRSYGIGATLTRQVSNNMSVSGDVTYTVAPGQSPRWQAGVQVGWQPNPELKVLTQGGVVRVPGMDATVGAGTQLSYEVVPGRTVSGGVRVDGGQVVGQVGYSENRAMSGSVQADTLGNATLDVTAGLSVVNGRVFVSRGQLGPGVLIHTGVAGLPLMIGTQAVTTDARGDALVILGEGVREVSVEPDFDRLPLTVTVQDDHRDVTLARYGVVIVDWAGNFTQNVWLRLLWPDGSPVQYGSVRMTDRAGQTFTTDDQGWTLLPKFTGAVRITVTEDVDAGQRQCTVTAQPDSEVATCPQSTP